MSAESVRQIITRAVSEPEFRSVLLREPAQAIAGYDLSDAEIVALRNLTPENFDAVVAGLEARVSQASLPLGEQETKVGGAGMERLNKLGG
jgi:hypothetical protein